VFDMHNNDNFDGMAGNALDIMHGVGLGPVRLGEVWDLRQELMAFPRRIDGETLETGRTLLPT
jgi:hypothetical protein